MPQVLENTLLLLFYNKIYIYTPPQNGACVFFNVHIPRDPPPFPHSAVQPVGKSQYTRIYTFSNCGVNPPNYVPAALQPAYLLHSTSNTPRHTLHGSRPPIASTEAMYYTTPSPMYIRGLPNGILPAIRGARFFFSLRSAGGKLPHPLPAFQPISSNWRRRDAVLRRCGGHFRHPTRAHRHPTAPGGNNPVHVFVRLR